MEGAPGIGLEIRASGERHWRRVENVVLLWEPLRERECLAFSAPAPSATGGGDRVSISCSGRPPQPVFQVPAAFYLWGPDGIYEEGRGENDRVRGVRWVRFDELLRVYDRQVAEPAPGGRSPDA